jgi:hypothetical protein
VVTELVVLSNNELPLLMNIIWIRIDAPGLLLVPEPKSNRTITTYVNIFHAVSS